MGGVIELARKTMMIVAAFLIQVRELAVVELPSRFPMMSIELDLLEVPSWNQN